MLPGARAAGELFPMAGWAHPGHNGWHERCLMTASGNDWKAALGEDVWCDHACSCGQCL